MTDGDELGKTLHRVQPPEGPEAEREPLPADSPGGAAPREALPVQSDGRYTLPEGQSDAELGRGGMGRVLTLVDTHLQRRVAVKELLREHTAARSESGPLLENLFVREARVLARLEHPGVVPVYELGRRSDGTPYYAMRQIRGRSLTAELKACATLDERLALLSHFIDVVQTVGFAHSKGIVHRDLKPDNVMVSRFGETQVIDWGLAIVKGEPVEGGLIAGTPAYMAPEQADGRAVDERSDVWALGVMLYQLLTDKLPFEGSSPSEILRSVKESPIPAVRELEPEAPKALRAVVEKALEREPHRRYLDAGLMADALEAAQRARAPPPRGWRRVAAVMGALALAFALWAASSASRLADAERDSRRAIAEAQHASLQAQAQAALAALRGGDTLLAQQMAQAIPAHPLARGVLSLAEERGTPRLLWAAKAPAGCSSLAVAGTTVACATLNALLLYGAEDGSVRGELTTGLRGWQHAVLALGEHQLVSGGDDGTLRFWDLTTQKESGRVDGFSSVIRSLAFDGAALFVGLGNGEVMRLTVADDLASGSASTVTAVTRHPRPVLALAATPGRMASLSEGLLRVVGHQPMEMDARMGAVLALSAHELGLGVERSVLRMREGEPLLTSWGHRDDVTALALLPLEGAGGALRLVSGSADGTVRWWLADGSAEGLLSDLQPGVRALAVTGAGNLVVTTVARRLEAWRLPERERVVDREGVASAHAWWPGGGLVTGYRDGRVRRLDQDSGERLELEVRHTAPVRALAQVHRPQSVDGLRLLTAGDDGRVLALRWNGSVEVVDALPGAKVLALAAAPRGQHVAWAADDGTRVLWTLEYGKEVSRQKDSVVRALTFSNDGAVLALGGEDKSVTLLDAQTGKERQVLGPLDATVTALAFSTEGAFLAGGAADGRVTLWDVAGLRVLRTWNQSGARIGSLAFHPEGKVLAAGSDDGSAWLFSTEDGALLAQVPGDFGDVRLVAFTDTETLVVVGTDRKVHHLRFKVLLGPRTASSPEGQR